MNKVDENQLDTTNVITTDPCVTLYLQPYEDVTQKEAKTLINDIKNEFADVDVAIDTIVVLPNKELPQKAYYAKKNRYLASILLNDLLEVRPREDQYIIGLTHKDISTSVHGYENYGIMGLTRLHHNASIVSDYRCKGTQFRRVILHEFCHGFYGANHCQDPNCIMCDYQYTKNGMKHGVCEEHKHIIW